jgi:hypothetical protein
MTIKKIIKNLWEKLVVHKYVYYGLSWGFAESYSYMGEPVGFVSLCKKMDFWESKYVKLGYLPVCKERWIEAGGYGREYESQLRRIKND